MAYQRPVDQIGRCVDRGSREVVKGGCAEEIRRWRGIRGRDRADCRVRVEAPQDRVAERGGPGF